MQVNDLVFSGYAGKDAEDRVTRGGTRIVTFSLCHTEKPRQQGDEAVSTWVRVKVFGGWCDTAAKIRTGQNVFIKGKLNVSPYTDGNGKERISVDVIVHALAILERSDGAQPRQGGGQQANRGGGGGNSSRAAGPGMGDDEGPPPF